MNYNNKFDRPEGAGLRTVNDPRHWEAGIPYRDKGMEFYLTLRHRPESSVTELARVHQYYTAIDYEIDTALFADLAHAFLVHIGDGRVKTV